MQFSNLYRILPKLQLQRKAYKLQAVQSIITARQRYGADREQDYVLNTTTEKVEVKKTFKEATIHRFDDMVAHFLPKGYPHTVSTGYSRFAQGQFMATVLGSAGGILATQSMLLAIGLNAGAIPLAATLNWVVKDGLGQLGGVIFASLVSNKFDSDPKRWRMLAAMWLEIAAFMELLTPLAPTYFIGIASVANIGKNISFLAASASRAAIHKSFATHENLADVTAKTGSQSVLSGMLGTGLGIGIAACIGDQYHLTVCAFTAMSSVSVMSTYYSLSNVTINSLSPHRMEYLLSEYLGDTIHHLINQTASVDGTQTKEVTKVEESPSSLHTKALLSPRDLRVTEKYLMTPVSPNLPPQFVGSDISVAIRSENEMEEILSLFRGEKFLINVLTSESDAISSSSASGRHPPLASETHIIFKEGAKLHDIVKGLTTAYICRLILQKQGYVNKTSKSNIKNLITKLFGSKEHKETEQNTQNKPIKLHQRLDVMRQARQISLLEPFPGVSIASDFADKIVLGDQWLVSPGMLETRFARVNVKE